MNGKGKIMVVEDNEDIRFSVRLILETSGFTVTTASNGQEALDLLREGDMPRLILLDMLMPIMDGWHFAAEFHSLYGHQIPIVVMTAATDAVQRAKDVEAESYVSKPFTIELLLENVERNIKAA